MQEFIDYINVSLAPKHFILTKNKMPKGFYLGEPQTETYNPQIYEDNIRGLYITSEVDASTLLNFWLRILGINPPEE